MRHAISIQQLQAALLSARHSAPRFQLSSLPLALSPQPAHPEQGIWHAEHGGVPFAARGKFANELRRRMEEDKLPMWPEDDNPDQVPA